MPRRGGSAGLRRRQQPTPAQERALFATLAPVALRGTAGGRRRGRLTRSETVRTTTTRIGTECSRLAGGPRATERREGRRRLRPSPPQGWPSARRTARWCPTKVARRAARATGRTRGPSDPLHPPAKRRGLPPPGQPSRPAQERPYRPTQAVTERHGRRSRFAFEPEGAEIVEEGRQQKR